MGPQCSGEAVVAIILSASVYLSRTHPTPSKQLWGMSEELQVTQLNDPLF